MLHRHCDGCRTVSDVIPVRPTKERMSHYLLNMLTYTIMRVTYHPAGGKRGEEEGGRGVGKRRRERRRGGERRRKEGVEERRGGGRGGEEGGGRGGERGGGREMTVVHTHLVVHIVTMLGGVVWESGTETGYQMGDKHKNISLVLRYEGELTCSPKLIVSHDVPKILTKSLGRRVR